MKRALNFDFYAGVLFLVSFSIPISFAQVPTATLIGTVKDTTGAIMPGAKITVINTATNLSRGTQTDQSGNYQVSALNPGQYRVEAEIQGFTKAVVSGIVLQVAQQARVDIELAVGEITQTLEVSGSAPLIDTESPMIGGVIAEKKIVGLPLNGRNFMELTTLTGGINEGGSIAPRLNKQFAPSAAGMPHTDNNYQLDGVDNKEVFFHTWNLAPSIDAVQEFRIQVGQYSAEFGAGGGAVVNAVTKSGTNEFHGAAWEFLRNDVLDARNFFLPANQKIASLRRNQFGLAAGGPIAKNRTFIFGNYEGTRLRQGFFRSGVVPTPAERAGDLSSFNKTLIDPITRQPFPGNIIPANRIDPISTGIVKYYSLPNNPSNPSQNYILNVSGKDDLDSYVARFDHRISSRHDFMARLGIQKVDRFTPGTFLGVGGEFFPQKWQNDAIALTSTISPTLLNEFRFGYNRLVHRNKGQNAGTPIAANLGISFAPKDDVNGGFPNGVSLGATAISGISERTLWYLTNNSFQWYDGITWTRGAHTVKAGADIRQLRSDATQQDNVNGSYTFTGQFSGDGFADFLLGIPGSLVSALKPNDGARFRQTEMAYYVLDDWKVSPKLTLSLGLRYQFAGIPREKSGLTPLFDAALGGLRYPSQNTTAKPFYDQLRPDLPYGFLDRETIYLSDKNNFAPRFGFAWRPFDTNRTVVRGGYGIYYSSTQIFNFVQNSSVTVPAVQQPNYVSSVQTPTLNYNGDIGIRPEDALKNATFGILNPVENQWLDAYTQQWSFSLGQELGKNFSLEAQYLGSKSTHVENAIDANSVLPGSGPLTERRPFPKWARVFGYSSGAAANYNALLVTAERRFADGLSFKGAYTFSKALTINGGRTADEGNFTLLQNPFNLRDEKGHSTDDISHRFSLNYIYELPLGPGKPFANQLSGIASKLIGGWSFAGIAAFLTGNYLFGPTIARANCNSSAQNICRPDLIGDAFLGGNGVDSPRFDRTAFDWPLNTARHPAQSPRFGSAGPNILKSNGLNNWDISILKSTPINEKYRTEFRAEFFNAWNHPNFGDPIAGPENPLFGRTFSTRTSARNIQFGLKFYW